jgi:hypothetical protein
MAVSYFISYTWQARECWVDFTAGIMACKNMLSFAPLHQMALEQSLTLLPWLQSWAAINSLTPLTPEIGMSVAMA